MALFEFHFVDTWNVWNIAAFLAGIGSAIVTGFMAWYTRKSVKQGQEQLSELKAQRASDNTKWEEEKAHWEEEKKQYEENNRAFLEISPVLPYISNWGEGLSIEIKNIGNKTAKNVHIEIDDTFVNGFKNEIVSERIKTMCGRKYRILPNKSKVITLCQIRKDSEYKDIDGKFMAIPRCTVFGQKVEESVYNIINEHLKDFSFEIKCSYDEHTFSDTLTTKDIEYETFNYQSYLKSISYNLSDINKSFQELNEYFEKSSSEKK